MRVALDFRRFYVYFLSKPSGRPRWFIGHAEDGILKIGEILFFVTISAANPSVAAPRDDWPFWARRFTGESDFVRQQAIQKLRSMKSLEINLRKGLRGGDRYLALDVIATLRMHNLLKDLIELSQFDASGMFMIAINSLVSPKNYDAILKFYRQSLESEDFSAASKVVILDTMGRLQETVELDLLEELLFDSSSAEVQSAALKFVRSRLLLKTETQKERRRLFSFLSRSLNKDSYQMRGQALLLWSELPAMDRERVSVSLSNCLQEPEIALRTLCQRLERLRVD